MFEDSLVESGNRIKAKHKYWSILTFSLNGGALIALIIWPLLHPEALPRQIMAELMLSVPGGTNLISLTENPSKWTLRST